MLELAAAFLGSGALRVLVTALVTGGDATRQLLVLGGLRAKGLRASCAGQEQDPFALGRHQACCPGLEECPETWDGSGRQQYRCRPSCGETHTLAVVSAPSVAPAESCADVWDHRACHGQFPTRICLTCGKRIQWLVRNDGLSEEAARERVALDHPADCGACFPGGSGAMTLWDAGYTVAFRDEFDATGPVDGSRWHRVHSHGDGFGNNEQQFYTNREDNSWVSDGTLKIRARREDFGGRRFTSAKLETAGSWLYGKFSVRLRLDRATGRGTWPAIWMLPQVSQYGPWPRSGEIDIMETVGFDPSMVYGTVHTGRFNHINGTQVGGKTPVDVRLWHVYTMEWRPDIILFACDGHVYQVFRKRSDDPAEWPFSNDFYLILNMAIGGWGADHGIDEAAFDGEGQIMEVDWVKVEQRSW